MINLEFGKMKMKFLRKKKKYLKALKHLNQKKKFLKKTSDQEIILHLLVFHRLRTMIGEMNFIAPQTIWLILSIKI